MEKIADQRPYLARGLPPASAAAPQIRGLLGDVSRAISQARTGLRANHLLQKRIFGEKGECGKTVARAAAQQELRICNLIEI